MSLLAPLEAAAQARTPYAAIVVDARNGKVLHQENADSLRYPASLTKMMTLYFVFEAMKAGRIDFQTPIPISKRAEEQAPTKLWVKEGQTITVEEAIHGLIIVSANDASTAVAEYFGGTQENFALMMNRKARSLGMMSTVFRNPNGLPDMGQFTTARDMATLAMAIRAQFPEYYHLFSVQSFKFRGREINGHNRLVGAMKGVDGLKTGFTNASRFNLATSYSDGERKLVVVVLGGTSAGARDARVAELINAYSGSLSGRTEQLVARSANAETPGVDDTHVASIARSWSILLAPAPGSEAAQAAMEKARAAFPSLAATQAEVETVAGDDTEAYRARFLGFATQEAAARACDALAEVAPACEVAAR